VEMWLWCVGLDLLTKKKLKWALNARSISKMIKIWL